MKLAAWWGLTPGPNRPVHSGAVSWATAGLLADPRSVAGGRSPSAAGRRQQPQATRGGVPRSACSRFGRRRSCAHNGRKGACTLIGRHRYRLYQPAAFRHGTHDVGGSPCAERRGNGACFLRMRQSVVTLLHQRPSRVERPGRSPAQCSAQRDRGAIGAAAAARLLQPLIWLRLPRSSRGISVTTEPRSRRRETATGRSNRRTRPESNLAEADVSRMRLAVLEVCARSRESPNDMRRIFGGSSRRRHIRPPSLRCRARAFCSHRAFRADAAKL